MNTKQNIYLLVLLVWLAGVSSAAIKPVSNVTARGSSFVDFNDGLVIDGVLSDASRWENNPSRRGEIWLQLLWNEVEEIQGLHIYSGHSDGHAVAAVDVFFRNAEREWTPIPSASIRNNHEKDFEVRFDATVDVKTQELRLVFPDPKDRTVAIREVVIWPAAGGATMPAIDDRVGDANANIPPIYLNQSGFNLGEPKRFTAPSLPDGTPFGIYRVDTDRPVLTGLIKGHIGDFSEFNPTDGAHYVVKAGGHTSVPFTVGLWQLERITYQLAMDFMIDSRHYVGNYTKPCRGSFGWRDDHAFAWVLRTLVPQYLSNPAAYDRMPKQVRYETPRDELWGALEPYAEDAPDIVKLIHWGADITVTQGTTHAFLKGELAYFLYAWPMLDQWLPQQNYDAVLEFVKKHWTEEEADREYPYCTAPDHNLFALRTHIGSAKGEYPPGHSVLPNLLMHAVSVRDGLPDGEPYFNAAYAQVEWMIENLDWEDPRTTKGQRMSEHITLTGLAAFLEMYPGRAPAGLQEKIQAWAGVAIRRAENMWDFRRLSDDGEWTPTGEHRTMWNEPGNVVGLPSVLLAAQPFIEDADQYQRLTELVWSHFDNAFGRNPTGRHFSYHGPREIEGVVHGWYSFYRGGIGQLEGVRFVLDGAPKHVHYPYHPEFGNYGWTEGWIQFNTAYNISLAYLAKARTELTLQQEGNDLVVRLRAPLNFDFTTAESVTLEVRGPKTAHVTLEEVAPDSPDLIGRIPLDTLGAGVGDEIVAAYGFGYMATTANLRLGASAPR